LGNTIFLSGFKWVVMLAPLGVVFYMSARINKMSAASAQTTFWVFASLMGLSLSSIFQFIQERVLLEFSLLLQLLLEQ